jgi:hypothetical protein
MRTTFGKPTMPILRLFPGRPKRGTVSPSCFGFGGMITVFLFLKKGSATYKLKVFNQEIVDYYSILVVKQAGCGEWRDAACVLPRDAAYYSSSLLLLDGWAQLSTTGDR